MKGIAILGTGPAGLMAAQACALAGKQFSLFGLPDGSGRVQPSVISGAQFMHVAVPTVSDESTPDMTLTYRKRGTAEGYARKVYESDPRVPFVSFANVNDGEEVPAWRLDRVYQDMWHDIAGAGRHVNAIRVDATTLLEWFEKELWDLVISTIPRQSICLTHSGLVDRRLHPFLSQEVSILQGEDMGVAIDEIVYNGGEESWYRSANISGLRSTEWGPGAVPPFFKNQARKIVKPISHQCDCWKDEPIVFAGRYGKWEKGVLVQDGFTEAFKALEELG